MKHLTLLLLITTVVLAGCAHDADYADREYGIASMAAYDQQIVHKNHLHADKTADGMDGIHAEPIMEMYHNSFGDGFTQETVNTSPPASN